MNNKLLSINETNILKGFAILSVIITHCNSEAEAFHNVPILYDGILTTIICNIGIDTFLFLSGYGLYKSYSSNGLSNYWKKRFKSVLIPYSMVQIILLISAIIQQKKINPKRAFFSILGLSPVNQFDGSMWYISMLIFFYILFYLLFKAFDNNKAAIILLIVSFIMIFFAHKIWAVGGYCAIDFSVGVFMAYIEENKKFSSPKLKTYYAIPFIICFIIILKAWLRFFRTNWLLENMLGLLSIILLLAIVISLRNIKIWNPLTFIGSISYMLYLTEMKIIVHPLKYISEHYPIYDYLWFISIIFTLIGIIIAYALTKVYKTLSERLFLFK